MRDSAQDLAGILASAGLGLSLTTNMFLGQMPEDDDSVGSPVPDKCVAILQTGGSAPAGYIGGAKKVYLSVVCQVRIRAKREDFQDGQTLAFGVLEALNHATHASYVAFRVRESSPFYGGTDSADRHGWALNVVCEYVNTPA